MTIKLDVLNYFSNMSLMVSTMSTLDGCEKVSNASRALENDRDRLMYT